MRLINIHTLQLEEYFEREVPPYAILSHRWTSEELNYKEVAKKRSGTATRGYRKLVEACRAATYYKVDYLWIDTCCIDKRSSAELSEAINSTYRWYENAKVCLAYLQDVQTGLSFGDSFKASVWFTRSWTLQELLAPELVDFFDNQWTHIGSKQKNADMIEAINGIPTYVLSKKRELHLYPVARRMSWAANRTATRAEDIAYSLMGIFNVNMPLLYGEGNKAFLRLQDEIIRSTEDPTILLWTPRHKDMTNRILACSPSEFGNANDEFLMPWPDTMVVGRTNIGLDIEGDLVRVRPHVYGLLAAENGSEVYVLLLSRDNLKDELHHRLGFESISTDRFEDPHRNRWIKTRRIAVIHGEFSQSRLSAKSAHTFSSVQMMSSFRFHVLADSALQVQPVDNSKPDGNTRWTFSESDNSMVCTF